MATQRQLRQQGLIKSKIELNHCLVQYVADLESNVNFVDAFQSAAVCRIHDVTVCVEVLNKATQLGEFGELTNSNCIHVAGYVWDPRQKGEFRLRVKLRIDADYILRITSCPVIQRRPMFQEGLLAFEGHLDRKCPLR